MKKTEKAYIFFIKASSILGSILGTILIILSIFNKSFRFEIALFTALCYGNSYYYFRNTLKKKTSKGDYSDFDEENEEDDGNEE